MTTSARFPLIVLVGPTGSGKSDLGLYLARTLGGEIVNYDSVQVYRGLNIGTAKVPEDCRRGIAHHLIDVIGLDQELNAGEYARMARGILNELRQRNAVPVLVGGTGFYLRALLDGLSPAPLRNLAIRNRLRAIADRRPGALHRYFRFRDPEAASRIHANDRQKMIRALEIILEAGKPASVIQSAPRDALQGFTTLKIGLAPERAALHEKLNTRTANMFSLGLVQEVEEFLKAGVSPQTKALQSIGYSQAVRYVLGHITIEQAITECQARTRQYAKRQWTWCRSDPDVQWIAGFGHDSAVQLQATNLVRHFLLSFSGK